MNYLAIDMIDVKNSIPYTLESGINIAPGTFGKKQ